MSQHQANTVGIILAGGEGRRLNGADKGLQVYKNKALIEHVIARLLPQVDEIIICANRNIGAYRAFGFDVVVDQNQGIGEEELNQAPIYQGPIYQGPIYQGPMAGINAAFSFLINTQFNSAVIVSCDAPKLPADLVSKLNLSGEKLVAVAHDGERRQNLHCLIKRDAWFSLMTSYQEGERAMHRWFSAIGAESVDFADQAESFLNINSMDQLSTNQFDT